MALASVHPSVRHTLQPYQNSDQKIFTVGHDKNFCSLLPNFVLLFEGIPLERGRQKKVPPKRRQFGVLSSSNVKTVADKYKQLVAYRNKHWSRAHLIMYSIRLHHSYVYYNFFDVYHIYGHGRGLEKKETTVF